MISKSLKALGNILANNEEQISILEHGLGNGNTFLTTPFQDQLKKIGLHSLKPTNLEIFQINVGKMCNQVCKHCHVDAGPDRKEIMTKATMLQCLEILESNPSFTTVDLTGGAPEMNPYFKWFVTEIKKLQKHIIVRCNLTIILANKKFYDLPEFFRQHQIEVVSSLPFYTQDRTDRQRGNGVFQNSIKALQMLNAVGYGIEDSGFILNLVYNPAGAFLPPAQSSLEQEYKAVLKKDFDIYFNNLYTITNMPISRYLDYLLQTGNYEKYIEKLVSAFNPETLNNLMCRNTLSVSWDGYIYDCDFNQMLDLQVDCHSKHIKDFNATQLQERSIVLNQHCYGCTAGAGSSCGGSVI
jgi:radical SAM/Cys-rich protein